MIKLKKLLQEGKKEDLAIDFLRELISGTEFENKVLVAGGAVRDELMGKPIKDIDVVVDLPDGGISFANWATKKMGNHKEGSNPILFPTYGTSKFTMKGITHNGVDLSDIDIEAVAPRAEEYEPGSRKPKVSGASLKADAERRDLTANSLFKNISTGEIVDLTGKGRADLEKGIARTPLDPDKTFSDDPLRMLRLVRFFVKYDWDVPMDQLRALKRNAAQIKNISGERVQEEFNKILKTKKSGKAFKLIYNSGIAQNVLPGVKFTVEKMRAMNSDKSPEVKLAVLFSDIPKQQVESLMKHLKYPNHIVSDVANAIELQDFFNLDQSLKTVRKFRRIAGRHAYTALSLMDSLNKPVDTSKIQSQIENMTNEPQKPPFSGGDLIAMGFKPGKDFKKILDMVQDKFEEDPNTSKQDYIKMIRQLSF